MDLLIFCISSIYSSYTCISCFFFSFFLLCYNERICWNFIYASYTVMYDLIIFIFCATRHNGYYNIYSGMTKTVLVFSIQFSYTYSMLIVKSTQCHEMSQYIVDFAWKAVKCISKITNIEFDKFFIQLIL